MQLASNENPPSSPPKKKATMSDIKDGLIEEILYDVNFNGWTPLVAAGKLGLTRPDFYELRNKKRLERFSIERLMCILYRLGHELEVNVI